LFRNLVTDLFRYDGITTTEPKAKETRLFAERMITLGKDGSLHARRRALAFINDPQVVKKLFEEVAPRYAERQGGYCRILRLGFRQGDGASVARLELV
jgi:large subunit ribosomal protein L17